MVYREDPVVRHSTAYGVGIDAGLRTYMLKVYNLMALALVITGVVSMAVASSPQLMMTLFGSPLKWVVMFAPLAFVMFFSFRIQAMAYSSAQMLFWAYSAVMGLSLSVIFMVFTGQSIARVFFITAGTFAATSLYGYTTQRDLAAFGSFLFMGLIGIVIASLVNIFMKSSAVQFAISALGVLIFTGLTAYNTQEIRQMYLESEDTEVAGKKALLGALQLYLNFINLFMSFLHLFGDRR